MNILIAPDSFKHSLSARMVAENLKQGLLSSEPSWNIACHPMADGGEGTVDVILEALGGETIKKTVSGPLLDPVEATYGILSDKKTAIIEMASASGLELLNQEELDPWLTTTYGTGELIADAMEKGCTKIIIGLGGSATNDGGTGMARALGAEFLDDEGEEVKHGGGYLGKIHSIKLNNLDRRIQNCEIIAATDVKNTLIGDTGASMVYAPQKGANTLMAEKLDRYMGRYAKRVQEVTGREIINTPGSGAAGGLAAGLMAFCNASIEPGFGVISKITGLEEKIRQNDIIITGEGRLDYQTMHGKVPSGIVNLAKKNNKKTIAVAGTLGEKYELLYDAGFDLILSIMNRPMPLDEALKSAPSLLKESGKQIAKIITLL